MHNIIGFVQELLGQGMPKPSFPSERGNLYVSYQVLLPPKLTPEARAALGEALK